MYEQRWEAFSAKALLFPAPSWRQGADLMGISCIRKPSLVVLHSLNGVLCSFVCQEAGPEEADTMLAEVHVHKMLPHCRCFTHQRALNSTNLTNKRGTNFSWTSETKQSRKENPKSVNEKWLGKNMKMQLDSRCNSWHVKASTSIACIIFLVCKQLANLTTRIWVNGELMVTNVNG